MKFLKPTLTTLCLLCAVRAAAWESALLPYNAAAQRYEAATVNYNGRNWRLPEFGYVGYQRGTAALGADVPCTEITLAAGGDISTALQQAIDQLGRGGGGRVRIPAGDYTMSRSVAVPYDAVAIIGAGSGRTRITVPANYAPTQSPDEGLFTFGKAIGSWNKAWIDRGDTLAAVTEPVAAGASTLRVDSAAALAVGQQIVVAQYFWPAFAQRHSGGAWNSYSGFPGGDSADRFASFAYLRRIVSISGTTVTIDAPLPRDINPADNPVRLRSVDSPAWVRAHRELGLAGLSISFADNAAAGGRPDGIGVYFEGVHDAFVDDVRIYNAPRYGLRLDHVARATLHGISVQGVQDYGEGGWGYGLALSAAQDILVRDAYFEDTRHGVTLRDPLSSSVVFTGVESAAVREGGDDTHHGYAHAILWDQQRSSYGSGIHAYYRGEKSGGAHETNGGVVIWNAEGDGYRGGWYGGSIQLNPASDANSIVVGGAAELPVFDADAALSGGERIDDGVGLHSGSVQSAPGPGSRDRNVLVEGHGVAGLQPASLYQAQLAARGLPLRALATACGTAPTPAPAMPRRDQGPGLLVFDSDALGYTAGPGSGCSDCDVDAAAAARGNGEGLRINAAQTDYAILSEFRGPSRARAAYETLQLWLRPAQPGREYRLRLSLQSYPEGAVVTRGEVRINAAAAGMWNEVRVPMAAFASGLFNTVELRSAGAASGGAVDLDDMRLLSGSAAPKQCSDGIDNDGDRLIDYPDDPACTDANDDTEAPNNCDSLLEKLLTPGCLL